MNPLLAFKFKLVGSADAKKLHIWGFFLNHNLVTTDYQMIKAIKE